jgi:DNA-binding FrmR family transcriptional regulator
VVSKLASFLEDDFGLTQWSLKQLADGAQCHDVARQILAVVDSAARSAVRPSAASRLGNSLHALLKRHATTTRLSCVVYKEKIV